MKTRTQVAPQKTNRRLIALAGSIAALLSCQSAHAATGSWNSASDGNWSDTTKWTSGTVANGATFGANFNATTGTVGTTYTTTMDSARTVGSVFKSATGLGNWTITSATNLLTLDNSTSNSNVSNAYNGNSTLTLDVDIALNSNMVLSGYGNNNAKIVLGSTVGGHTITGAKNITLSNTTANSGGSITINSNINTSGGIFNNSTGGTGALSIAGTIGSNVTGVTQNGAITLTLSGANTYTSATTINVGTLRAGVASVAGVSGAFGNNSAVTIANAASTNLNLNGFSNQIGSLSGGGATGGNVILGAATLTTGGDNTSTSFSGVVSGTGGFTKIGSGTQTLNGVNTYSGATTISAGTLALGASGTIASSTNINLGTTGSRGTLDLTAKSGFTFGAGQTLAGYGTVNIGAGKAVTINGNLAPGNSPGVVTVTGDLVLANAATVPTTGAITTIELGGNGGVAGTDYDQVAVSGQVTFGGTLNIVSYAGYNLNQAGTYHLFTFGSQTGSFDFVSVAGSSLTNTSGVWTGSASSYDFTFTQSTGDLVVASAAIPEPGSFALLGGLAAIGFVGMRRRRQG